jgi:tetratricopeptide (TPR) repeat protein
MLMGISATAQEAPPVGDLKTPAAAEAFAKLRTEPGIYQFLSSLALERFKNGDRVKAVELVTVVEHFWDSSANTKDILRNSPDTERAIDRAMDVFIDSLKHPQTDGSANRNAEAAYTDYVSKLQFKLLSDVLSETIKGRGIDAAIQQYRSLRDQQFPGVLVTEADTNFLGYELLRKGEKASAVRILQINVDLYPKSANVYDSLGEAYAANGQKDHAIENYRKALAIDPTFESSLKALKALQGN